MKKDINNTNDIRILVDTFYSKVKTDADIGYIFTDIANVNWEEHLPKMYAFWGGMLLGNSSYRGDPMQKHIELNKKVDLTPAKFQTWLNLWKLNVDEKFAGPKAEEAKSRAAAIMELMSLKVQQSNVDRN